jgi:C4-dicarboxylate transporter DctM subunit
MTTTPILTSTDEATTGCIEQAPPRSSNVLMAAIKWLDENLEKPFLFLGMLSIILIITFQTFYRYVGAYFAEGAAGAIWTEELARFIFIWISYLAIPVAIKKRNNIRVDIIYDRIPARFQAISWVVVDLCFLTLVGVVVVLGFNNLQMLQ